MKKISEEEIKICCLQAIAERRKFIESCEEINEKCRSFLDMSLNGECAKLDISSVKKLHRIQDSNIVAIERLQDSINFLTDMMDRL